MIQNTRLQRNKVHIKHTIKTFYNYQLCQQVFTCFCSLRLHSQKVQNAQKVLITTKQKLGVSELVREIHGETMKEKLELRKHFL